LRKPADATAKKLLNAFRKTRRLPEAFAKGAARALRMPRPTTMADVVAIEYDVAMA